MDQPDSMRRITQPSTPMRARPTANQPGSLKQQFQVIAYYLADPDPDRDRAYRRARMVVLQHARRRAR